jgi:hypothetical protein
MPAPIRVEIQSQSEVKRWLRLRVRRKGSAGDHASITGQLIEVETGPHAAFEEVRKWRFTDIAGSQPRGRPPKAKAWTFNRSRAGGEGPPYHHEGVAGILRAQVASAASQT